MQAIAHGAVQGGVQLALALPQTPGIGAAEQGRTGGGGQPQQQRDRLALAHQQNASGINGQGDGGLEAADALVEGHHAAADIAQQQAQQIAASHLIEALAGGQEHPRQQVGAQTIGEAAAQPLLGGGGEGLEQAAQGHQQDQQADAPNDPSQEFSMGPQEAGGRCRLGRGGLATGAAEGDG